LNNEIAKSEPVIAHTVPVSRSFFVPNVPTPLSKIKPPPLLAKHPLFHTPNLFPGAGNLFITLNISGGRETKGSQGCHQKS
jgi:hypothetical protein